VATEHEGAVHDKGVRTYFYKIKLYISVFDTSYFIEMYMLSKGFIL